jgi:hypothetical protein
MSLFIDRYAINFVALELLRDESISQRQQLFKRLLKAPGFKKGNVKITLDDRKYTEEEHKITLKDYANYLEETKHIL